MTRDEILAMEAGLEMDALIAEKVMGWHIVTDECGGRHWYDSENHYQHGVTKEAVFEDSEDFHLIFWHPSESILWAWQVFEFLKDNSTEVGVFHDPDGWRCSVYWFKKTKSAHEVEGIPADTAPLAICRAALIAVMENE